MNHSTTPTRIRKGRAWLRPGWLALATLPLAFAQAQIPPVTNSNLSPVELRCEYAVNPAGIDVPKPRLYWKVASQERGQHQTAYQILAASSPEALARGEADVWDSGRTGSYETQHHRYQGRPLRSSETVYWKVRVWDALGEPSTWSPPARWTMGLLSLEEWQGQWICAPAETEALLLRKEFTVKPGLTRAVAHVCGLGQYELFLNGGKVGADLLSPGWTGYNDTTLYDTREVTGLLQEGPNALGMALGNGMYRVVRRNRFAKFTGSFGPLRAIVHLRLEYADGSTEFLGSDPSWRIHPGPITYSSIYGGEDFDARRRQDGWNRTGFEDRDWANAVAIVRPASTLKGFAASAEPLGIIEVRRPVKEQALPAPGVSVYDLGQNTSYMPRLRVSGPAGSSVRLTPAEIVLPDGSIDRRSTGSTNRGISWWQYTLAGSPAKSAGETWFPQFYYVGCRYLQAERIPAEPGGELPMIESLEGCVVHSVAQPIGTFECSNPLLNRIRDLVRWAQRANMVSILTDCPHREKLGWLEQYHLNGPAIRYEFDMARMFTKGMNDMADAQLPDGLVPNIAPEYTEFKGPFRAAAEWGAAYIIVPWQQYQFNGDLDLLREHYRGMKRYFAYLESRAEDNIVSEGLGDWYDLGPNKSSRAELTPPPVTATAFYYRDAWILSQVAGLLDQPEEAKTFADQAERIRAAYNRQFFHADQGSYASGSQCANALPLVFGIVDPTNRPVVLEALVRDVESRGFSMTAGDIGFRFLLQALAQGGRSDVVYRLINQDDKPGYGYQLKLGATSLTESWDAKPTASHNHFMLGHITEWFYKDLCGIGSDPAGPGFKRIIIHPSPVGDLQWARASYNSPQGIIVSDWRRDQGRFTLNVTIPANTVGTVHVPADPAGTVTVNGVRNAGNDEGVAFLGTEGNRAVYMIVSGSYRFESSL
jgi:hypothetical protein